MLHLTRSRYHHFRFRFWGYGICCFANSIFVLVAMKMWAATAATAAAIILTQTQGKRNILRPRVLPSISSVYARLHLCLLVLLTSSAHCDWCTIPVCMFRRTSSMLCSKDGRYVSTNEWVSAHVNQAFPIIFRMHTRASTQVFDVCCQLVEVELISSWYPRTSNLIRFLSFKGKSHGHIQAFTTTYFATCWVFGYSLPSLKVKTHQEGLTG